MYTEEIENENLMEDELDLDLDDVELSDINDVDKQVVWQSKDYSLREFMIMNDEGDLKLQPDYQRKFVTTTKIASKLIESVLMDVPIPVIYLAEERDSTFSVIDGQQRLTSFISFMRGQFPDGDNFRLTGLKVHSKYNRKSFFELPKELQNKIKKTTIHTIIIKRESDEDIKFDIFERLNTGSTKLNEDEIRNTVYRGEYVKLLSELENNVNFHRLVRKENSKKRMIYRGMILRFFALSEKSYINYRSSMRQFCNKELRDNRYLTKEKQREYIDRFEHCIDLVKTVFGDTSFRRYIPGNGDSSGKWASNQINMALYDLQMVGFANYSKSEILSKADLIREGLLNLMIKDINFQEVIGYKTSDTDNVKKRFKIYMEMLESIIGDKTINQRTFSYQLKQELFHNDPFCKLSGQRILNIDDAEVDHIIPYSKGGKTEVDNAQLVLRYFNRAKRDNEDYSINP